MAFHTSRSRLVRRKDMDAADMALCLLAIRICPLEKYITAYSRRDRATIGRQQWIRSHLITPATLAAQKQRLLSSVPQHAQIQRALARSPQVPLALQEAEWARRRRGL
jgi:predicted Co/Zn/Cd cation transporter (cation efflux family)